VRGKEIFAGNLAVVLYRGANVMILSALSASAAVVMYSIAEKAIKLFQAGATPLNQLVFPKVIRAMQGEKTPNPSAFFAILKYTIPQLGLLAIGGAGLAFVLVSFRSLLPQHLASALQPQALELIAIMSIAVFFGVANFMLGMGGLNHLGRRRYFAKAILAAGLLNLPICSTLVAIFGQKGAGLSYVLAEAFLFGLIVRVYFSSASKRIGKVG
jgi:PST family polysaccharide transporter